MGAEGKGKLQTFQMVSGLPVRELGTESEPSWGGTESICNWDKAREGHIGGGPGVGGSPKEVPLP